MTGFLRVTAAIIRKDIQAELRSRELISTMILFALLAVLIFSFALELDRTARESVVSGVLWVTVIFASILGLNRSMVIERENGCMDALLVAPVDRAAVYVGKLIGNYLLALLVGLLLLPLMTLLYNIDMIDLYLLLALVLGTLGISTTGTLLSAMTVQTRARESLLPIVILPVVLPVLLSAVNVSNGVLNDAPVDDWVGWLGLVAVIDILYFVMCFVTFPYVVEE